MAGSNGNAIQSGAAGGTASGGDLNLYGSDSGGRGIVSAKLASVSMSGAAPFFGGSQVSPSGDTNGVAGVNYGAGGTGAQCLDVVTNFAGGAGAAGVVRITEYF